MRIERFGQTVTVTRSGPGFAVNGTWVKGPVSTFAAYASIQPLRPRELLILPEGERTRERIRAYTNTRLLVADETTQAMGDRLSWNGRDYEVQQCETWQDGRDTYYKAIAVLVEQDVRRVDMEKINVRTYQAVVATASSEIIAANAARNYLRIENKDGENAATVKVGVDFLTPASEAQKITFSAVPTAGVWAIKLGAGQTQDLAFDANAGAVQTQLRTLPGGAGMLVTGDYTNGFTCTWAGANAETAQPLMAIADNALVSNANEAQEVQVVAFSLAPAAGSFKLALGGALTTAAIPYTADSAAVEAACAAAFWPAVTVTGSFAAGFTFTFTDYAPQLAITVPSNTLTNSDTLQSCVQKLAATALPTEGQFQLQFNGQTTSALDYNCTSQNIADALNALTSIPAGQVTCSGSNLVTGFSIVFDDADGDQNLITVWNNTCMRHDSEVLLQVASTQAGIGPAACAPTVTESTPGHGNDAVAAAVAELTKGVPDNEEGYPLPAGGVLEYSVSVPIQAFYGKSESGEGNDVVLEISEG